MFFRSLHAVARHTPLHIIVAPNGEQLRLIVTPKPSGDAADNPALAKPFTATGTPEELDAELPEVLRRYTESVNDLRARLDLPLDELDAAKAKVAKKEDKKAERERQKKEEEERRSAAAKKAAETRAANAAAAKEEKERKARERAEAKAAKKAGKVGAGIQVPGQTAPAGKPDPLEWPFPTGSRVDGVSAPAEEGNHRADLPGKPECLRDYANLARVHGDKLTRRLFIKKAKTSRRYEKLWANWEKFVKDAKSQAELPLEQPNDDSTRAAESAAAPTSAASGSSPDARSTSAPAPSVSTNASSSSRDEAASGAEPDKKSEAAADAGAAEDPAAEPAPAPASENKPAALVVLDTRTGRTLGTWLDTGGDEPRASALITLADQPGAAFCVDAYRPGVEIHAHRVRARAWAVFDETGNTIGYTREIYEAGAAFDMRLAMLGPDVKPGAEERIVHEVHEHDHAYTVHAKQPKFRVTDEQTGEIVAEFRWVPGIGEKLTLDGRAHPYRVLSVEGQHVSARAMLSMKKALLDEAGNPLGSSDEIYEVTDQVGELADREWRVLRVEENAYIVKAAKPRLKGPAASTAAPAVTE